MSAHLVVIDKTARRHTIKVSPEISLNEVLLQACKKAGVDSTTHGLKHANKTVDLSLPFRYSKLVPGAKLELIQLPKARVTSAEVTVALQMMDSGGSRLTSKFPSTATIWQILRAFEAKSRDLGVAGINITEAASAPTNNGSGRLFYAMPVVQIVNRELATIEDLQLTLQAMGFNSGTALLRLKMRPTEIPLEEALVKIAELAPKDMLLPETPSQGSSSAPSAAATPLPTSPKPKPETEPLITTQLMDIDEGEARPNTTVNTASAETNKEDTPPSVAAPDGRQVTVFAPAQSTVPQAAKLEFDESVYELNITQAKLFQSHLQATGRPQRLLSDTEVAKKEKEMKEKKEKIEMIEVRVRFPDQMIIQAKFKGADKAEDLYSFISTTLRHPNEPFYIYLSPPVRKIPSNAGRLVLDCQFTTRTLVNFSWDSNASKSAQTSPALKDEYLHAAREIKVQRELLELNPQGGDEEEDEEEKRRKEKENVLKARLFGSGGGTRGSGNGSGAGGAGGGGGMKVPKWLKLGGK